MEKRMIICFVIYQGILFSSEKENSDKKSKFFLPSIQRSCRPTAIIPAEIHRRNSLSVENTSASKEAIVSREKRKKSVSFVVSPESCQSEQGHLTPEFISPPEAQLIGTVTFAEQDICEPMRWDFHMFVMIIKYAVIFADKIQKDLQFKKEKFSDFFIKNKQDDRYTYYLSLAHEVESVDQKDSLTFQNFLSKIALKKSVMFCNFIDDHVSKLMILRKPNAKNIQDVILKLPQKQESVITWNEVQQAIQDAYRIDVSHYSLTQKEQDQWVYKITKKLSK